jgi:hypothetical protein
MTATTVAFVAETAPEQPRLQVRERLEQEYVRLREVERPALLRRFDAAGAGAASAIAAIQLHLDKAHDAHADRGACPDCCVLLDRGEGPQWFLLAALSEHGLPVIASDSALGRALLGARPGETVEYPDPTGTRAVRVLALT